VIYCRSNTEHNQILLSLSLDGGCGEEAVRYQNIDFKSIDYDNIMHMNQMLNVLGNEL